MPRPPDHGVPDAGRVIAGAAKGVRLRAPGPGTRPLADRVKQTLFAILEPDLPGARVLDLFAGSGAAGIEALSRGAGRVAFVERDRTAVDAIAANLRSAGFADRLPDVHRGDVLDYLRGPAVQAGPFDLVIVDPPYGQPDLLRATLDVLGDPIEGAMVSPGTRVVAKHFWRDRPPERVGMLALERERRFGETALAFYRREEDG